MNFELTDEQRMLSEAAREALGRHDTIAAARAAADGADALDLWPTAVEAGWAGLLCSEQAGGAGLGFFDAMLVAEECGRRVADAGLLGHLPASLMLQHAAETGDAAAADVIEAVAGGSERAAAIHTAPPLRPGDDSGWTVDGRGGPRLPALRIADGRVSGIAGFQPDLAQADLIVALAVDAVGEPKIVLLDPEGDGIEIEPTSAYDASRRLAHLSAESAPARVLEADAAAAGTAAWNLAQALLGADALGVAEAAREMALAYAKDRHTFGRPIGSYQAVKHNLVEMLRLAGTARSLTYYAGLAETAMPGELTRACACVRAAGEQAANYSARMNIATHGGIGVTWEHDAPFFWRRAQLSRILLGGEAGALERVAESVLQAAAQAAPAPEPVAA
jgi:alkylation response protein AidB-like acyl-CoA dehydrogenase